MSTKERANLILSTLDGKIGYSGEHPQEFVQSQIETAIAQDRMSRPDVEIRHENQDRLTLREDPASGEMTYRSLGLRADTWDDASNSVACTLSSEDPVTVFDWERGMIDEVLLADGGQYPSQMPMLDAHQRSSVANVLGSIREPQKTGSGWTGRLHFVKGDPASDSAALKVKQRHITDVSIGYRSTKFVDIPAGQTATVNGKQYTARADRDLRVTTAYTPREASLVPIGADQKAKIRGEGVPQPTTAPAESGRNGVRMNPLLRKYLESLGLRAEATEADAQAFAKMLGVSQRSIADDITGGKIKTDAELAVRTAPASPPPSASATPATLPVAQPNQRSEDQIREETLKAERERIKSIREIAGTDVKPEIVRRAIDESWTKERAAAEFLTHLRAGRSPTVGFDANVGVDKSRAIQELALAASLVPNCERHAAGFASAIQEHDSYRELRRPETWTEAVRAGRRYAHLGARDFLRQAISISGGRWDLAQSPGELMRSAVSGGAVSGIFTTSAYAVMLMAWDLQTDTTDGWVIEDDVQNFLTHTEIDYQTNSGLKRLGRGGTAEHSDVTDSSQTFKLVRYAKKFSVDEMDIIDDQFGKLLTAPAEHGIAARRLRPQLVYSLINQNATYSGGALFNNTAETSAGGHANLGNVVLSADGLKAAITRLGQHALYKGKGGKERIPLNIQAETLVIPSVLQWTARELIESTTIIIAAAGTTDTVKERGTKNVLSGSIKRLIIDDSISDLGCWDPANEVQRTGSATNYYLVASPGTGRTFQVSYRKGTGRVPQLRSYVRDEGAWGIGWDINYDVEAHVKGFQAVDKGNS